MAAEAQTEVVLAGLAAQLLAKIRRASGYHYDAARVHRPSTYMEWDNENVFDKTGMVLGVNAFFSVRGGDETLREETSFGYESEFEVFVLGATLHTPRSVTSDPSEAEEPIEQTVQERLRHDILKAVYADVRLGGDGGSGAFNAEPVLAGRNLMLEDWAIVEVMLTVQVSGLYADP